eukprot:GHVP01034480.1.p1 GENE.GHVP01034480.1~~GHVP01034480.1.p1  ORF type:complete len:179 (+),score=20.24 GHVP01034480.1:2-538(+)
MDKILNPIYPGDDDPNARFLEEHILRTSIPSECDKTFSMYGRIHSRPPATHPGIQPVPMHSNGQPYPVVASTSFSNQGTSREYVVPRKNQSRSSRTVPYPPVWSQHDNAGSSTTASATNEEALWEEVIQKIDTTSKIEISSTRINLIIKFFREEEICQIQIPRNAFYPDVDSREGNLT